jgi:hypothetical protein
LGIVNKQTFRPGYRLKMPHDAQTNECSTPGTTSRECSTHAQTNQDTDAHAFTRKLMAYVQSTPSWIWGISKINDIPFAGVTQNGKQVAVEIRFPATR